MSEYDKGYFARRAAEEAELADAATDPDAEAAHRRLQEEMGFDCTFRFAFSFEYRAQVGTLIEHELDHVFVGDYQGSPVPSPEEVVEWAWVDADVVSLELFEAPEAYTEWFKLVWERVRAWRATQSGSRPTAFSPTV